MGDVDEVVELVSPGGGRSGRIRLLGYPADGITADWTRDLPAECGTFTDAVALPLTTQPGEHVVCGAIYTAAGDLVVGSERGKANRAWGANPPTIDPPANLDTIEGATLFAGHYRGIFGHLLLEVLPRLWPDLDLGSYDRVLVYPTRVGRRRELLRLPAYAADLLVALGLDASRARILTDEPLRLAQVTVPSPALRLKVGYAPEVTRPFDRVAAAFEASALSSSWRDRQPTQVYLSRSRLSGNVRRAENELELEDLFQRAGFAVVHPQELPIRDQVLLMRGATAVAGCDGSALHLAAFCRPGTQVVAVDSRPVVNQFLVEDFSGLDAVHVLAADDVVQHRSDRWHAEIERVQAALALAGHGSA